jgi:hypothetical protein
MGVPSTNNHFKGETPFKVQVKFDIPLFQGQIEINALEKWLSLLEGYFSIQNISNSEKITFMLLKVVDFNLVRLITTNRFLVKIENIQWHTNITQRFNPGNPISENQQPI